MGDAPRHASSLTYQVTVSKEDLRISLEIHSAALSQGEQSEIGPWPPADSVDVSMIPEGMSSLEVTQNQRASLFERITHTCRRFTSMLTRFLAVSVQDG